MRPFGTLWEPQWIRKKSSGQLRSSSIDGSCRMVRTGTRKIQKRSMCFRISGHHISAMLLTTIFLMFWVLGWLWKIKIRSRKSILVKIFIKNIFFWRLIIFHSCCKILCFTLFPILLKKINFGSFLLYVIIIILFTFWFIFVKNPPPN